MEFGNKSKCLLATATNLQIYKVKNKISIGYEAVDSLTLNSHSTISVSKLVLRFFSKLAYIKCLYIAIYFLIILQIIHIPYQYKLFKDYTEDICILIT